MVDLARTFLESLNPSSLKPISRRTTLVRISCRCDFDARMLAQTTNNVSATHNRAILHGRRIEFLSFQYFQKRTYEHMEASPSVVDLPQIAKFPKKYNFYLWNGLVLCNSVHSLCHSVNFFHSKKVCLAGHRQNRTNLRKNIRLLGNLWSSSWREEGRRLVIREPIRRTSKQLRQRFDPSHQRLCTDWFRRWSFDMAKNSQSNLPRTSSWRIQLNNITHSAQRRYCCKNTPAADIRLASATFEN